MENNSNIQRIWLVYQDAEVPGGCCPDLPDSAYLTLEDAKKRIKVLYEDTYEHWKNLLGCEPKLTVSDDGEEAEVEVPQKAHYYFRTYIGCSIPLIKNFDKDWEELEPQTDEK